MIPEGEGGRLLSLDASFTHEYKHEKKKMSENFFEKENSCPWARTAKDTHQSVDRGEQVEDEAV
jgi:hypothetical protein